MTYRDIARRDLEDDEGNRLKPYRCTAGKLSIGIGRNLDDKGIRPDERDLMFENDLNDAEVDARALVPNFDELTDARKAVLLNMAFNLGRQRLGFFTRMLAAVKAGRWNDAADEMMASKWAKQVQASRSTRLERMMREG